MGCIRAGTFQHCFWVIHVTVAIGLTEASMRSDRGTQGPGEMVANDGEKGTGVWAVA